MAAYGINDIRVIGNLTKDPDHFVTKNDKEGARFTVAVSNNKNGVNYYNVIVYGGMAQSSLKYLHKGDKVYVGGDLCISTFEYKGTKVTNVEINATNILFLNTKSGSSEPSENQIENQTVTPDDDMPF